MFMIIRRNRPAAQRGDTIVEVLISLTVISLVLGGAYVTTNKSLIATRSSQERSSALKLAESQVEQLKGIIESDPAAVFGGSAPSPFCVYNDTATSTLKVAAASAANCALNTAGAATTVEPKFNMSITRSGNDFTVKDTWSSLSGTTTNQLQIKYRLYQ